MIRIADGGMPWVLASFALTFLFIGFSFFTTGALFMISCFIAFVFFLLSCLLVVFFRDPDRTIGPGIVAVADGKIREIITLQDPEVGNCTRISTFMNIHNVHVNRMPCDGIVENITHTPGSHLPAFTKESDANERVVLLIRTLMGPVKVVQIAGSLARRIVPYVAAGDEVKKGEKIGLIRLGSRVDVYLPTNRINALTIHVDEVVKAGEDTIAKIHA